MSFAKRRQRLRKLIRPQADAMLVTHETNVRYLTGFTGDSSYLVVTTNPSDDYLISDPRYQEQIEEECPGLTAVMRRPSDLLMDFTCRRLASLRLDRLLIESGSVTVEMYDRLCTANVGQLCKGSGEVESLRAIKDADEIALLETAVDMAQRAFLSIRAQLMPTQTEREIAFEIERIIRQLGGEGCSFKPIVAAGPRAALPHAVPGDRLIGDSPFLLMDWGALYQGYRSDLTRVLLTSKIPAKIAKAYEAVLAAQTAAIAAMKPGVSVGEVDRIARESIAEAGMGKRFNHGLGHGVGLDIHESPRIGKNTDLVLEEGMVVTVEPGVYYPGFGGIRIEDDVLITRDGVKILSTLPRTMAENRVEWI